MAKHNIEKFAKKCDENPKDSTFCLKICEKRVIFSKKMYI
jgi:hypothetical protein